MAEAGGRFWRAFFLALLAALFAASGAVPPAVVISGFFLLWTACAFVGSIVAVPYNDIVARAVAPAYRSRMLAVPFFRGGVLALVVAAAARGGGKREVLESAAQVEHVAANKRQHGGRRRDMLARQDLPNRALASFMQLLFASPAKVSHYSFATASSAARFGRARSR